MGSASRARPSRAKSSEAPAPDDAVLRRERMHGRRDERRQYDVCRRDGPRDRRVGSVRHGVGKGAVLRVFFEGFGWATGHVQKVTRDGAVDVFWVSDASYSTITRSVAAAHVVLPALISAPMHALASKNGVVGCRGL